MVGADQNAKYSKQENIVAQDNEQDNREEEYEQENVTFDEDNQWEAE